MIVDLKTREYRRTYNVWMDHPQPYSGQTDTYYHIKLKPPVYEWLEQYGVKHHKVEVVKADDFDSSEKILKLEMPTDLAMLFKLTFSGVSIDAKPWGNIG